MKNILTALSLMVATPAMAADEMTLLLDWYINPDHGPIIVAQEKGYFAENGLDVNIIPPSDPSAPPRLVAAGQAEIAVSYQPQLHLQVHEGLPLKRVGTLVATPLNCLLVLQSSPYKSPADLKGTKIGYSVAGVEEAVLDSVLATHGVALDDVELINVNFSLIPALMSGQVDAVIGAYRNIELNQLDIEGAPGTCFYVEEEGVPTYDELIYVANPELMNTDVVARFLEATERATQYIVNSPEESWEIFSSTSPELQDELNKRMWKDTIARFALRPAGFDAGRYARYEKFLLESGLIETERPVTDFAIDVTAQ